MKAPTWKVLCAFSLCCMCVSYEVWQCHDLITRHSTREPLSRYNHGSEGTDGGDWSPLCSLCPLQSPQDSLDVVGQVSSFLAQSRIPSYAVSDYGNYLMVPTFDYVRARATLIPYAANHGFSVVISAGSPSEIAWRMQKVPGVDCSHMIIFHQRSSDLPQ